MMPTLLALAAQAATPALDADTSKAAMACASAVAVVNDDANVPRMRAYAEVEYYLMTAAAADVHWQGITPRALAPRLDQRARELVSMVRPERGNAEALVRECDTRFPVARKTNVALPGDAFEQDIFCPITLQPVVNFAEHLKTSGIDLSEYPRWKRVSAIIGERHDQGELATRGFDSPQKIYSLFDRQYAASLEIGNVYSIGLACEKSANS